MSYADEKNHMINMWTNYDHRWKYLLMKRKSLIQWSYTFIFRDRFMVFNATCNNISVISL